MRSLLLAVLLVETLAAQTPDEVRQGERYMTCHPEYSDLDPCAPKRGYYVTDSLSLVGRWHSVQERLGRPADTLDLTFTPNHLLTLRLAYLDADLTPRVRRLRFRWYVRYGTLCIVSQQRRPQCKPYMFSRSTTETGAPDPRKGQLLWSWVTSLGFPGWLDSMDEDDRPSPNLTFP